LDKDPKEAMKIVEEALALNVYSVPALTTLSDAAKKVDANFIAIEAMEIAKTVSEDDSVIRRLVELYKDEGDGAKAYEIQKILADRHPEDLTIQAELRSVAAFATLKKAESMEGSAVQQAQELAKSSDDSVGDKIIRSEEDVAAAILRYEEKVNAGDESVDMRRALAELYQRAGRHDDAIQIYYWIAEKIGTLDPATDKAIEKSEIAKFNANIAELEANGSEAEIQEIQTKMYQYKLERAEARVKSYPNDTQLRYDLACLLWEDGKIDAALEQFQLARKNPQRRLSATVYIGMCFAEKGQYDMAVEQFESAISEMHIMDKTKLNALYQLGVTSDKMGNDEKALDCFKKIYQTDINYLDVSERMQKYYNKS
jgi:tetratricopeptide (TPR) repeat protein